jgi:hypothetical protein
MAINTQKVLILMGKEKNSGPNGGRTETSDLKDPFPKMRETDSGKRGGKIETKKWRDFFLEERK